MMTRVLVAISTFALLAACAERIVPVDAQSQEAAKKAAQTTVGLIDGKQAIVSSKSKMAGEKVETYLIKIQPQIPGATEQPLPLVLVLPSASAATTRLIQDSDGRFVVAGMNKDKKAALWRFTLDFNEESDPTGGTGKARVYSALDESFGAGKGELLIAGFAAINDQNTELNHRLEPVGGAKAEIYEVTQTILGEDGQVASSGIRRYDISGNAVVLAAPVTK